MTKTLPATCQAGVVLAGDLPLPGAVLLGEGVGASEGVAVLDGTDAYYLPKTSPDLKTTLEKLLDVLTAVKTALQDIATGPVTATQGAAGPTLPALATKLNSHVASLTTAQTALNTLKGALK